MWIATCPLVITISTDVIVLQSPASDEFSCVIVPVPTYLPSKAVVASVGTYAAAGIASALRITKAPRKPRNLIPISLCWRV
jgi:hypothetical protein